MYFGREYGISCTLLKVLEKRYRPNSMCNSIQTPAARRLLRRHHPPSVLRVSVSPSRHSIRPLSYTVPPIASLSSHRSAAKHTPHPQPAPHHSRSKCGVDIARVCIQLRTSRQSYRERQPNTLLSLSPPLALVLDRPTTLQRDAAREPSSIPRIQRRRGEREGPRAA